MKPLSSLSLNTMATVTAVVLAVPLTGRAEAQERPRPVADLAAGALFFADDGVVREGFFGGDVRLYVLPRISMGPELTFIQGKSHSHLMLTGNVTFDLLHPVDGKVRQVTPFVTVGGGLFQTRETFRISGVFTSSEGAFTAGGGVRAIVGKYLVVGAEGRIGWELHIRLNGIVGVRFGR